MNSKESWIDFGDIQFEEVEVLVQEGSRGIPEFAASSCDSCGCGTCSCGQQGPIIVSGGGGSFD